MTREQRMQELGEWFAASMVLDSRELTREYALRFYAAADTKHFGDGDAIALIDEALRALRFWFGTGALDVDGFLRSHLVITMIRDVGRPMVQAAKAARAAPNN